MKKPFKKTSSKNIYENPWLSLREDKVKRQNGKMGVFAVAKLEDGVSVLAITKDRKVFLTKEYRYAMSQETVEVVSGGMNARETPLQTAKRELKEESGISAKKWTSLGKMNPFTSIVDSTSTLFIAEDLSFEKAKNNPEEIVEIIKVPLKKAVKMVMENKIVHGPSCVLILKADKILKS